MQTFVFGITIEERAKNSGEFLARIEDHLRSKYPEFKLVKCEPLYPPEFSTGHPPLKHCGYPPKGYKATSWQDSWLDGRKFETRDYTIAMPESVSIEEAYKEAIEQQPDSLSDHIPLPIGAWVWCAKRKTWLPGNMFQRPGPKQHLVFVENPAGKIPTLSVYTDKDVIRPWQVTYHITAGAETVIEAWLPLERHVKSQFPQLWTTTNNNLVGYVHPDGETKEYAIPPAGHVVHSWKTVNYSLQTAVSAIILESRFDERTCTFPEVDLYIALPESLPPEAVNELHQEFLKKHEFPEGHLVWNTADQYWQKWAAPRQ